MKTYIQKLLPRLREFSKSLDRQEVFIDHPWVFIDSDGNHHKYIFRRKNELVMSYNGSVTVGTWEYLSAARALLVDRGDSKILLMQDFIHSSLMILKKDGPKAEPFVLVNENLVPTYDIEKTLYDLFLKHNQILLMDCSDGRKLEIHHYDGLALNKKATLSGESIKHDVLESVSTKKKYIVNDSVISKILIVSSYKCKEGVLEIEHDEYKSPGWGDEVRLNGNTAPDGKYKVGFLHSYKVLNGRLVD